jgi:20S proteasome alpha/beta subunit
LDVGDATHLAIKALKNSFDGELTYRNIEVGIIKTSDPEKRFHVLTQDEIKDLLREVDVLNLQEELKDLVVERN